MTTTMTDTRKSTNLTQAVRNDVFLAKFITDLGSALDKVANRHDWTAKDRGLAVDMVKSTTKGDGSTPEGISDYVAKIIQSRFVSTCIRNKVRAGSTISGTNTEWFTEETERYNARRASQHKLHAKVA